jgi:hypothetical protein
MDLSELLYRTPISLVAAGMLVALLVGTEVGYRSGSRIRAKGGRGADRELGAIHGAVLGLLGLLLAFTYSFAAGRSEARHEKVVKEANAIGTAYLRAGLLTEPARVELQGILRTYVSTRLVPDEVARDPLRLAAAIQASAQTLGDLWPALERYLAGRTPTVVDGLVVQSLNEVIDVHGERLAAANYRVPPVILWLVLGVAVMAMAVTGWGAGLDGPRNLLFTATLAALVVAVVIVIIDLDNPRAGFIRINQKPMTDLRDSFGPAPDPTGGSTPSGGKASK